MAAPRAFFALEIRAPIDRVWSAMIDTARYPEWNPFVIRVDGVSDPPRVGDALSLHVRWANGRTMRSPEELTRIDPPREGIDGRVRAELEYAFRGFLDRFNLVRGRRSQRLLRLDEHTTRYESEEVFEGWLARGVPLANVQDGFERHARALARRAERDA